MKELAKAVDDLHERGWRTIPGTFHKKELWRKDFGMKLGTRDKFNENKFNGFDHHKQFVIQMYKEG